VEFMLETILVQQRRWIVLTTQPHRENFASGNLVRQGFEVYCPMAVKRIRHARRVFDAPRPLFPGYLFAEHRPGLNRWRAALGTYGVRSVVCNGDAPAMLPGSFIESLKAREISGVIRKPQTPFVPGQTVLVNGGPFDGLAGQIVEVRERDRILLLLDLLSSPTKVHLDAGLLIPA
jgi:transcriptional antiterminator RfaH